jgi:hypothetical protein
LFYKIVHHYRPIVYRLYRPLLALETHYDDP